MPFVQRYGGVITAVYAGIQPGRAEEDLPASHPDIVAYYAPLLAAGFFGRTIGVTVAYPTVFPED